MIQVSVQEKLRGCLVLIDKPAGPTSAQVAVWVRQILGAKCGHCGTLDPPVSGVLPVLVGKGIKLLEFLQLHDKEYVCVMRLGARVPETRLREAFSQFMGEVFQQVPEHAAVVRRRRVRRVHELELLETRGTDALFRVKCQHGFYVRQLVEDLAVVLDTKARLMRLRRTQASGFTEDDCCTLTQLADAAQLCKQGKPQYLEKLLLPLETAAQDFPKIRVKQSAVKSLQNGAPLYAAGVEKTEGDFAKNDTVALMADGRLIAVGKAMFNKTEMQQKTKGAVVDLEKVLV